MIPPIQTQAPKFGTLTLDQQKRLATARNGGTLSAGEEEMFKQLTAYEQPRNAPMSPKNSTTLNKAIRQDTVERWRGLLGSPSKEQLLQLLQSLDELRQMLMNAPFEATDQVVNSLVKGYEKVASNG